MVSATDASGKPEVGEEERGDLHSLHACAAAMPELTRRLLEAAESPPAAPPAPSTCGTENHQNSTARSVAGACGRRHGSGCACRHPEAAAATPADSRPAGPTGRQTVGVQLPAMAPSEPRPMLRSRRCPRGELKLKRPPSIAARPTPHDCRRMRRTPQPLRMPPCLRLGCNQSSRPIGYPTAEPRPSDSTTRPNQSTAAARRTADRAAMSPAPLAAAARGTAEAAESVGAAAYPSPSSA